MSEPVVSIVISAYNAGPHLADTLACCLAQSYRAVEIVLVDDGSTDGSVERLAPADDSRLHLLRQENAGKSVALNRALEVARGDYYCILDADDLMHADRVARQVEALEANPDLAAVFCGHELILDGRRVAPLAREKGREACGRDIDAFRIPAHDPTVMFRRSMVSGIRYDPDLRIGQGYDYILRVGETRPMMVLGECLYSYRVHRGSNTRRRPEERLEYIRRVIDRARERRGSPGAAAKPGKRSLRGRSLADNNLAAHFMESVVDLRRRGRWRAAIRTGLTCSMLSPLTPHYHKALAYAIIPATLRRLIRPSERWQGGSTRTILGMLVS